MEDKKNLKSKKISLGFTNQKFEPGIHICQLYTDEDERHNALVDFVISGLEESEDVACFTEKETSEGLSKIFIENGASYDEIINAGLFSLSDTQNTYFGDNKFDPDKMLDKLQAFYEGSKHKNCEGARVIGEMIDKIEKVEGGDRWIEYESKVTMLVEKYPLNVVCQYDARAFKGETLMGILKVHPYMIIKGAVVNNPFFIKPEKYLSSIKSN